MEHIEVSPCKFEPNEYQFLFTRITENARNKFEEALDYMDTTNHLLAIKRFEELVKEFPEFIDAWVHLGLSYKDIGEQSKCLSCVSTAVYLGKSSLPEKFNQKKNHLIWVHYENRPFLRACHSLGLEYQEIGWYRDALELFHFILDVNPDDNQGVRELVIECYLGLCEYSNLISFFDKNDDSAMTGMVISHALALIGNGELEEANKVITSTWQYYKLIWKELLKKRHTKPSVPSFLEGYASTNGSDMAYIYWKRCGKYWEQVDGALDLLRNISLKQPK